MPLNSRKLLTSKKPICRVKLNKFSVKIEISIPRTFYVEERDSDVLSKVETVFLGHELLHRDRVLEAFEKLLVLPPFRRKCKTKR